MILLHIPTSPCNQRSKQQHLGQKYLQEVKHTLLTNWNFRNIELIGVPSAWTLFQLALLRWKQIRQTKHEGRNHTINPGFNPHIVRHRCKKTSIGCLAQRREPVCLILFPQWPHASDAYCKNTDNGRSFSLSSLTKTQELSDFSSSKLARIWLCVQLYYQDIDKNGKLATASSYRIQSCIPLVFWAGIPATILLGKNLIFRW